MGSQGVAIQRINGDATRASLEPSSAARSFGVGSQLAQAIAPRVPVYWRGPTALLATRPWKPQQVELCRREACREPCPSWVLLGDPEHRVDGDRLSGRAPALCRRVSLL